MGLTQGVSSRNVAAPNEGGISISLWQIRCVTFSGEPEIRKQSTVLRLADDATNIVRQHKAIADVAATVEKGRNCRRGLHIVHESHIIDCEGHPVQVPR